MRSLLLDLFQDHIFYQTPRRPEVSFNGSVEFYEDQEQLPGGTIYLAEARQWKTLSSCRIAAPCCCIISSSPDQQILPLPNEYTEVLAVDLPLGVIYNRIRRLQREDVLRCRPKGEDLRRRLSELWTRIHSGQLLTHDEIYRALSDLTSLCKSYYRILCLHSEKGLRSIPNDLLPALEEKIPDSLFFFPEDSNGSRILGIQFFDHQPFSGFENREDVCSLLTENGLRMMVSNSTKDFSRMNLLYLLTRRTNRLADVLAETSGEPLRFFEEFTMYTVLEFFFQRFSEFFGTDDIIYLAHPAIVHLMRYDQTHGTNLRQVLYQYLQNNRDLKRTADALYMHRNTVINKLNQIRNICPMDFEDGGLTQRLLFSCQLIQYYESELREQLRP